MIPPTSPMPEPRTMPTRGWKPGARSRTMSAAGCAALPTTGWSSLPSDIVMLGGEWWGEESGKKRAF